MTVAWKVQICHLVITAAKQSFGEDCVPKLELGNEEDSSY